MSLHLFEVRRLGARVVKSITDPSGYDHSASDLNEILKTIETSPDTGVARLNRFLKTAKINPKDEAEETTLQKLRRHAVLASRELSAA